MNKPVDYYQHMNSDYKDATVVMVYAC